MHFFSSHSLMILNSVDQLLGSVTFANASAKQFIMSTFAEIMFPSLLKMFTLLGGQPLIFLSFSYVFASGVLTFIDSRYCCLSWHFHCLNVLVAIVRARFQLIFVSSAIFLFLSLLPRSCALGVSPRLWEILS